MVAWIRLRHPRVSVADIYLHPRVITIDARTGKIQKEFGTPVLAGGTDRTKLVSGIDWADRKTLRYARGVLPETGRARPDPILLTVKL